MASFKRARKSYTTKECGMTKAAATRKAAQLRKEFDGAAMKLMENGKYCVGVRGSRITKKAATKKKK